MVAGVQSSTSSYARIHPFFAFALLATISFLAIFTWNTGHSDIMPGHQRRSLVARQDSSSSSQTASRISAGTGTSTSTFLSSTSIPNSSSTSQSSRSLTATPTPSPTTTRSSSSPSSSSSSSSFSSSSSTSQFTSSSISSSSSSSTLSSITSTASVVVPTTNSPLNVVPITTLVMSDSLRLPTGAPTPPTDIQTQPTDTPTSLPVGAASTSAFWNNKAAVVATFIIVAVAICGAIGLAILYFLKKRNARMERELHEELFEKHTDPHRSMSPSSSINGAPIDPFASDNDLRVRHNQQSSVDSHHSSQRGYHSTSPIQHPDFYDKSAPFNDYVVASTYLPPSRAAEAARPGPPSAFRNPATQNVRASYQPSLDSFYGGIAQGPSTGYPRP